MKMEWIKCPLNRYTFSVLPIKTWVELECEGKVLNLFAGKTKLMVDEVRNDINKDMLSGYHMDALDFVKQWNGCNFDTILLDPPYSYRKSMEMYNGNVASPFRKLKDILHNILNKGGKVITFGYHSIVMGERRGFVLEKILVMSHGGAIHDTIVSVERSN